MTSLKEQVLRFDASDALRVNQEQRLRHLSMLAGLDDDQWRARSRCEAWTVQDVTRHLCDINEMVLTDLVAARAGERSGLLRGFDPKTTPAEWLTRSAGESPAETLARFERTTTAWLDALESLTGVEVELTTPVGRQPWQRASLHYLFDASVHERDCAHALGAPAVMTADEVRVIGGYELLLCGRTLCVLGLSLELDLGLGDVALQLAVAPPEVSVAPGSGSGLGAADAPALLDAMTGRGDLPGLLGLDPEDPRVQALGVLRTLM